MTDRRPKHECAVCGVKVRQIGKHMNQKHPEPLDLDGLPFCPSGYAQRYHVIDQCNCTPEEVEEP